MPRISIAPIVLLIVGSLACASHAQTLNAPTAFTYQGRLDSNGTPLTDAVLMEFRLFDVPFGGAPIGVVGLNEPFAVEVVDGLFQAELDFGAGALAPGDRYLEIAVSDGPGGFTTLEPRQRIGAAPMAIQSAGARAFDDGSVGFNRRPGSDLLPIADQPLTDTYVAESPLWQSFTATRSGSLARFAFRIFREGTQLPTETRLFRGEGASVDVELLSESFNITNNTLIGEPGVMLFEPVGLIPIVEGETYTFEMVWDGGAVGRTGDVYPFGRASAGPDVDTTFFAEVFGGEDNRAGVTSGGVLEATGLLLDLVESPPVSPQFGGVLLRSASPTIFLESTRQVGPIALIGADIPRFDGTGTEDWRLRFDDLGFSVRSTGQIGSNRSRMSIRTDEPFMGINTGAFPLAPLHVSNRDVFPDLDGLLFEDDMIIEDEDAILGIYSETERDWGSGIKLGQVSSGGGDSWTLVRESNANGNDLTFVYGAGGDYTSNARLFNFQTTGELGIRVEEPEADLHIFNPDEPTIKLQSDGNSEVSGRVQLRQANESGFDIYYNGNSTIDTLVISPRLQGDAQVNGDVYIGNTGDQVGHVGLAVFDPVYRLELPNLPSEDGRARANRWDTYSSERYKTNIATISDPVQTVGKLRGVTFDWNAELGGTQDVGFIAEEVAEVFPELVQLDDEGKPTSMDYSRLVPVAVEAIKAQQVTIREQEARIARLEAMMAEVLAEKRGD